MGYLYIITHKNAQNIHKIGITKEWDKRSKALKVGRSTYCNTLVKYPGDIEKLLEKEMHAKFADHRLPQSEWFNLNSGTLYCLRSSVGLATAMHKGELIYDIEKLSEQEEDEETIALKGLIDWLNCDVYENFLEEKYRNNPFLYDFEVSDLEDQKCVNAYISFVQPNNKICSLNIIGYYCPKKKDTFMYLAEPGQSLEDWEEAGNWYSDNYGHEEIELDEYADILLERLRILADIDKKIWPSKVLADITKTKQMLREHGVVIYE